MGLAAISGLGMDTDLGQWRFNYSLREGYGLVLRNIRHGAYLFSTDIRVVGIQIGQCAGLDPLVVRNLQEPLRLGTTPVPRIGEFLPNSLPVPPDEAPAWLSKRDESLIFSYPNPKALSVFFRTTGPALTDGSEKLVLRQTYLFTDYGKNPPHEPGALVNAARLYPLLVFRYPEGNPAKGVSYIRVDYRLALAIEDFGKDGDQAGATKDLVGLFRDNDELPGNFLKSPMQHPLRLIFDNIEKPLAYEVVGEGLRWGKKGEWDNFHQWPAGEGPPPTPGANHAAHCHWRFGPVATTADQIGPLAEAYLLLGRSVTPQMRERIASKSRFAGIGGSGTALIDPRLPYQRLRVAVTTAANTQPADNAVSKASFQSMVERPQAPAAIPSSGTDLVVWLSIEAVRVPSRDAWEGAFFVNGLFFTHDIDIIRASAKVAGRVGLPWLASRAEALHDPASFSSTGTVGQNQWERPNKLQP